MLVMEEASEVAQAASKCLRFTPDHRHYANSNLENLKTEVTDLITVLKLLETTLNTKFDLTPSEPKLRRIEKYLNISREMNTLCE